MSDLIGPKCPPAIVTCLKKQEIDTIPVFTNPKSPHIQEFVNSHKSHFVQDKYYSYISSRYSKEKTEKLEYRIPEAKYLAGMAINSFFLFVNRWGKSITPLSDKLI